MKPKKLLQVFKNPPKAIIVITILLTVLLIALDIVLLVLNSQNLALQIVSYIVYGLSAIFFGYLVYIIVTNWKNIGSRVANFVENNDFAYVMVKDLGYRSVILAFFSLLFGIAYAIFNGVMAIYSMSVWYFSLSIYCILLALTKGAILVYQKKKLQNKDNILSSVKTYRNSGIALLIIHLAITVAVLQMLFVNRFFVYPGLLIYVAATYSFFKITTSIMNIIKSKRIKDYTIKALFSINLADSVISILALQTAMLNTFGTGGKFETVANAITGTITCLFTLGIGIHMIIKGQKEIKQELNNGRK